MAVTLNINNQQRTLDFDAYMPLLWAIRDVVGLTGTKFGCGAADVEIAGRLSVDN